MGRNTSKKKECNNRYLHNCQNQTIPCILLTSASSLFPKEWKENRKRKRKDMCGGESNIEKMIETSHENRKTERKTGINKVWKVIFVICYFCDEH